MLNFITPEQKQQIAAQKERLDAAVRNRDQNAVRAAYMQILAVNAEAIAAQTMPTEGSWEIWYEVWYSEFLKFHKTTEYPTLEQFHEWCEKF